MESSELPFSELLHFGGFDYAGQKHYVVVVDRAGSKVLSMEFDNTADGWRRFLDAIKPFPKIAFTIETSCGADVERLLDAGLPVYPINPKSAQRYRDRKSVAGCKSDELDAFCMADALRTDGAAWRRLLPMDPTTHELRVLCRDEIHLIELRTSLINQLRATLHQYYPVALEAFTDWVSPSAWDFVITFPTPAELVSAGKRKWQKFLFAHHMTSQEKLDERTALFAKANEFTNPVAAVISGKSLLATTLAKQLRVGGAALRIPVPHHGTVPPASRLCVLWLATRCGESSRHGCLRNWVLAVRSLHQPRRCRRMQVPRRSRRSLGSRTSYIFDGLAIVTCEPPFTSGWISAATIAFGPKPITSRSASKAWGMQLRSDASASAGSIFYGASGKKMWRMTKRAIRAIK